MQYTQGALGRVFIARLEDGESVYDVAEQIARRESLSSALLLALGGVRRGKVVTGPKQPTGKIVPHVEEFDDARELVGVGTIFPGDGKPSLHFHAAIGRRGSALVGCPRIEMAVFLVLEVIIIELLGIDARRALDPSSGLHLLTILAPAGRTP